MSHPVGGVAWHNFDRKHKIFAGDVKNKRIAITANGFNLFGNFSSVYSMCPVLVTPPNLSPRECVNPSNCFMSLLIPGLTSLGKDFESLL
jgi:hypothetical protein